MWVYQFGENLLELLWISDVVEKEKLLGLLHADPWKGRQSILDINPLGFVRVTYNMSPWTSSSGKNVPLVAFSLCMTSSEGNGP